MTSEASSTHDKTMLYWAPKIEWTSSARDILAEQEFLELAQCQQIYANTAAIALEETENSNSEN